ncbi:MAG: hypothetical protein KIT60_07010 [Burkholderiaceae bacterium]|nr:hypothetical protein [Burkholderiaceae bacterium]
MSPSKILQALLGLVIAIGFFVVTYVLLVRVIPPENKDLVLILIGQLSGAFLAVVGFAFGSSAGSQRKDELGVLPPKLRDPTKA